MSSPSLSILTTILQVYLGYPVFIEAKDDGGGEWWQLDYWSYKLCKARSQIITNIQFFVGQMPFLSTNQQCPSTEGMATRQWVAIA